jgi:uncharacterized protein (TIGR00369 family)
VADDAFANVRASFARQGLMAHLGARLVDVGNGTCTIALAPCDEVSQQHGFVHAGAIAALADTASGYAALAAMAPDEEVLTIEFKLNLLAPATGDELVARGEVLRAGRTVTVCESRVVARTGGAETLCAVALVTLMRRPAAAG